MACVCLLPLTIIITVGVEPQQRDNGAAMSDSLRDDDIVDASKPDTKVKNNPLRGLFNRKKEDPDVNNAATEPSEKELSAQQSEKSSSGPSSDQKVNPLAGRHPGKY
jgi:hypothetical protein